MLGKNKEALFVAAKKPAKKAAKAAKKPAQTVAKKPVVKKAVAKKPAPKPAAKKDVAPAKDLGAFPYVCLLEPGGKRAFVSLWNRAAVAVIDLEKNAVAATWPTAAAGTSSSPGSL